MLHSASPSIDPRLEALMVLPEFRSVLGEELQRRGMTPYATFQRRYFADPAAFAEECIRWPKGRGPKAHQLDVLDLLFRKKRVSPRGPHGLGKTFIAAVAVHWFALTRDGRPGKDWKVPTTAGAWRQLTKFLWPEIHKIARMLDWGKIGRRPYDPRTELLALNLKLTSGEAFAVASDIPELIEGVHADSVLYIYDESKAIKPETFDASEGAFMGAGSDTDAEALAYASSTPGAPHGRFFDIQSRKAGYEDWAVRHVTLDECITAGLMSSERVEQRKRQWGENSAVFLNRVKGEFASTEEDTVIPLAWVEAAVRRWEEWSDAAEEAKKADPEYTHPRVGAVGVDVADGGADKTVFAPRSGRLVFPLRKFPDELQGTPRLSQMEIVGRLQAYRKKNASVYYSVDVIGIGSGAVSRLRELAANVIGFNASEGTKETDMSGELEFANTRAAAWWKLRELLDPQNGHDIMLPPDDEMIGDLTAPKWRPTSTGKILIESKDDIRSRIGRSTDSADAVVMSFWVPSELAKAEERIDPLIASRVERVERLLRGDRKSGGVEV